LISCQMLTSGPFDQAPLRLLRAVPTAAVRGAWQPSLQGGPPGSCGHGGPCLIAAAPASGRLFDGGWDAGCRVAARCDRVLVMDGGRVADSGPPGELLSRPGWFSEQWGAPGAAAPPRDAPPPPPPRSGAPGAGPVAAWSGGAKVPWAASSSSSFDSD